MGAQQIRQATIDSTLKAQARVVKVLAARVSEAEAQAAFFSTLAQGVRTTNFTTRQTLFVAMQALAPRLTAKQAETALGSILEKPADFVAPFAAAQFLPALTSRLDEAQVAAALLAALRELGEIQVGQTDDFVGSFDLPAKVEVLAQTIQALAPRLNDSQAEEALGPVLQQARRASQPNIRWAKALWALSGACGRWHAS